MSFFFFFGRGVEEGLEYEIYRATVGADVKGYRLGDVGGGFLTWTGRKCIESVSENISSSKPITDDA